MLGLDLIALQFVDLTVIALPEGGIDNIVYRSKGQDFIVPGSQGT